MKSLRPQQAGFYGQALLIAAPLLILSAVALYSLRLDRSAIDQDARDRAQALVPELAQHLGQNLSREMRNLPDKLPQGLLVDGQILFPIDYPRLPTPPDWPAQLKPEQRELLRSAEEAIFRKRDPNAARNALAAVKAAGLPEPASAHLELSLLLLESRYVSVPHLGERLTDLAHRYPKAYTETGTPIADLALIQALRFTPAGPLPDALETELSERVRSYPSFLVPELLEAAARVHRDVFLLQQDRWLADQGARDLLRTFLQHPIQRNGPGEIWLEVMGQEYLALYSAGFNPETRILHVLFVPARQIEELFLSALPPGTGRIPSFAAINIQLGSRHWPVVGGTSAPDPNQAAAEVLASAAATLSIVAGMALPVPGFRDNLMRLAPEAIKEIPGWPSQADGNTLLPAPFGSAHTFRISLTMARPDLLYAGYRRRLWLMAGLILCAMAAAGAGLAGAWRAFRRQSQLAEMTSNFVSSVSHELRAPLASVRLMAESLDQDRVTDHERRKDYYRLIVQECRRLSSLVENVLDFSRIRQGRKRYEFEPVDLTAMIRQTIKLLEPNAAEHKVGLVLTEPISESEEMQPCWDGQAVQQALVNLIDNAIKHSPPGVAVKVAYSLAESAAGSNIRVVVEDQGPGVPAEEQEKIFEPFYRRGSELHRETKGIGIGLSLVKHIAEAHGGLVLVESVVGQGSRFILELPAGREPHGNEYRQH